MRKIITFLAVLLLCYSCNNKTEDEDCYQIITVHSENTSECLVSKVLYNQKILDEKGTFEYVKSHFPFKSANSSDDYWIYSTYYKGDEVILRKWYILTFGRGLGICIYESRGTIN